MRVFGVTGWKNCGKTGLVERLVAEFRARGLTISTVKHSHHGAVWTPKAQTVIGIAWPVLKR